MTNQKRKDVRGNHMLLLVFFLYIIAWVTIFALLKVARRNEISEQYTYRYFCRKTEQANASEETDRAISK